MADVMLLVSEISTPIKVAWILWLTWAIVQIGWYRRSYVVLAAPQPLPFVRVEPHRAAPPINRSEDSSELEPVVSEAEIVEPMMPNAEQPSTGGEAKGRRRRRASKTT